MSCILYYSKYCKNSEKLLQQLSKSQTSKDIHFVCIDKRVKEPNGKVFILFENGQKMLLPDNITKIPALLLLNQNYNVLYGDEIYKYFRPKEEIQVKKATNNNMVPTTLESFGGFGGFGGFSGVVSDNYSFLDQSDKDLGTTGNGGLRQMHSYVSLNEEPLLMHLPKDDQEYKTHKIKDGEIDMDTLISQRQAEVSSINYRKI
jgi:hypothetical protein